MDSNVAVTAVAGEIVRTVALAAWRRSPVRLITESERLAGRHPAAMLAVHEVREHLARVAAARHVPIEFA